MAYRTWMVLGTILFGCYIWGIVGSELFWGSLVVAGGAVFLYGVPFIWIPLGLMVIGGLLTEPFLFTALVIGFGCFLAQIKP